MSRNDDTETNPSDGRPTSRASVSVRNIGGIDDCEVTLTSGITVLTGRNATNRTSFLSAIAGVLGGSAATLKTDADRGSVELSLGEETYEREYVRENGTVVTRGEPYVDDPDYVDAFACLLETNPARRAVERGDDLREVIMRPVDTDAIRREIREQKSERDELEQRLDDLDGVRQQRAALERKREDRRAELDELEDELADVRETVEALDAEEVDTEEAESMLDELERLRDRLDDVQQRITHQESELDSLREDRSAVVAELADLDPAEEELADLDRQRNRLQRRKRELDTVVDDLSRVVAFNDDLLESDADSVPGLTADDRILAELDPTSKTVKCWTCGSRVERSDIDDRLDTLRDLIEEKSAERDRIEDDIEGVDDRRTEIERAMERQSELQHRLENIDREIAHREEKLAEYEAEQASLRDEIADVEDEVAETGSLRDDALDAYRRLSRLEYERGQLESELAEVERNLDEAADAVAERERVAERLSSVREELGSLRSHVENLERDAVEAFNEEMATVLELLEYDIARVWIERKTASDPDEEAVFDLHVVRGGDDGTMYEDTVETLSESEREVIGLVVGLAGYLVHDVYETVPFVLLDSLEAIDSNRIAALVEYFAEYAQYLVVALLPEDAQALPAERDRIPADRLG